MPAKKPANKLIRDQIPLGQKREFTLEQAKQLPDGTWAVSVSDGTKKFDDNVVSKSIGWKPSKGIKQTVVIERQPDESISNDVLSIMRV